ncbi:MAG: hypothetical protein H0U95_02370 [Bacteroidetes bacterium]|nr:hypothetical protein [Bacteroidota bacterium]
MNKPILSDQLSYCGYCNDCKKIHSLPSEKAITYCYELMENLRKHRRIDFETHEEQANPKLTTNVLYSEQGGQMFGILVCSDANHNEIILRAFSSTHNGVWNADGWVPHLANETEFMDIVEKGNLLIHPLTDKLQTLNKGSDEWQVKIHERKQVSRNVLTQLFALYNLQNFKKEIRSLSNAFIHKTGIPNGTGDCCAPKLLNYAAKNNLKPISIAEFYWGRTSISGERKEGEFYSSCTHKCEPLLGFMLCGSEN